MYVGISRPTSIMVFWKKKCFYSAEAELFLRCLKNHTWLEAHLGLSDPNNSEDEVICKYSLQLNDLYYSIVTRSSIFNVGVGPTLAFEYIGVS